MASKIAFNQLLSRMLQCAVSSLEALQLQELGASACRSMTPAHLASVLERGRPEEEGRETFISVRSTIAQSHRALQVHWFVH